MPRKSMDSKLSVIPLEGRQNRLRPPASLSEEEKSIFGELTRQWIIWHVLEHEIHHGGELSLALGGYGLEGIYGNA